jgi:hypothetical protein
MSDATDTDNDYGDGDYDSVDDDDDYGDIYWR